MSARRFGMLAAAGAVGVAGLVPFFASCAEAEDATSTESEGSTLPPTNDAAEADAPADAGLSCDASDPSCVTHVVTCAEATWCPVPTAVSPLYALVSVWGASADDVWASGSGGTVIHWDGTAWASAATGLHNTFHTIVGTSATDVWAVSASDVLLHTNGFASGGTVWKTSIAAADEFSYGTMYAAWSAGAGQLRIGGVSFGLSTPGGSGSGNQYVRSTLGDGGIRWTGQPGAAVVHGIWGSAADDVWIIGDNSTFGSSQLGYVSHGTKLEGGLGWQDVDSQSAVALHSIWGSSKTDVWTVGDIGTIRHLGADGERFAISESHTGEHLNAIWGAAANDIWAVGDAGTILHYDGTAWTASTAAFAVGKKKPALYGVWGAGTNDVWIVGDGVALHKGGTK